MENIGKEILRELAGINNRLDHFEGQFSELKDDVRELKEDVAELKTEVKQLRTDVEQLKTEVKQLRTDVDQLKTEVGELKVEVKRINGVIENQIEHEISLVVDNHVNLERRMIELTESESSKLSNEIRLTRLESVVEQLKLKCAVTG